MEKKLLSNITGADEFFKTFFRQSISYFYEELYHFMSSNKDYKILEYANEQSLACMFVNAIIRHDIEKQISALQEYGIVFESLGRYGRPDIFIRVDKTAFFIECKYYKTKNIREDHWNIKNWLEWDRTAIFNQVLSYCKAEKLNESFTGGCYAVTMVFKLIDDEKGDHSDLVNQNIIGKSEIYGERDWYYTYETIKSDGKNEIGLEVYGTFKKM